MDFSTEPTDIVICSHMKKVDIIDNVRHFQSRGGRSRNE